MECHFDASLIINRNQCRGMNVFVWPIFALLAA